MVREQSSDQGVVLVLFFLKVISELLGLCLDFFLKRAAKICVLSLLAAQLLAVLRGDVGQLLHVSFVLGSLVAADLRQHVRILFHSPLQLIGMLVSFLSKALFVVFCAICQLFGLQLESLLVLSVLLRAFFDHSLARLNEALIHLFLFFVILNYHLGISTR